MKTIGDLLQSRTVRERLRELPELSQRWTSSIDAFLEAAIGFVWKLELAPNLGELPGCTADDVSDAWRQIVLAGPHPDFDSAYEHFCKSLALSADRRWRSDPLTLTPVGRFETLQYPNTQPLWTSADGRYAVEILGSLPSELRGFSETGLGGGSQHCRVVVAAFGTCTERFFAQFCDKVVFCLSSLLASAMELNFEWFFVGRQQPSVVSDCDRRLQDGYRLVTLTMSPDDDKQMPCPTLLILRDSLSAIFSDVLPKKDSMDRRIKNAVRLLVEAKRQNDNAIGLALSVAAIESLLCKKGDNVAQMFAETMAKLLEPLPEHRTAAEGWCKKLYDRRSSILHGSDLTWTTTDVANAEKAGTAVLKAMLERRAASRRVGGESEKPDELLKEIKDGKYRAGQPVFVEETPLSRLWREVSE